MAPGVDKMNTLRLGTLVVLLVGLLGPWSYTSDGMPPPEFCQDPNFLLNDHCVRLVTGMEIFLFFLGAAISIPVGLVTGSQDPTGRAREFLTVLLYLTPGLPLVTTLPLLSRERTRLRILHALAWGGVMALCLFMIVNNPNQLTLRVWGLWLSLVTAAGALVFEGARSIRLKPK